MRIEVSLSRIDRLRLRRALEKLNTDDMLLVTSPDRLEAAMMLAISKNGLFRYWTQTPPLSNQITIRTICELSAKYSHGRFLKATIGSSDSKDSTLC